MNWLQAMYDVIGASYPRLSLVIAATVGAIVFGGGWWLIGKQYAKDHATVPMQVVSKEAVQSTLLPAQQRLLELLAGYQRQFAASKLVIARGDGSLHFDDASDRSQGISIIHDLYGIVDARNAGRFEELMQSMPPEYVRLTAEAHFDNPFVASVTSAGMNHLGRQK